MRLLAIAAAAIALLCCAAPAHAYPSSWKRAARCIHWKEADVSARSAAAAWPVNWHLRLTWDGRSTSQHGGMQIDLGMWRKFAPKHWPRDPADATRAQQLFVAWRIWLANGRRWGGRQWPNTSRLCGVP